MTRDLWEILFFGGLLVLYLAVMWRSRRAFDRGYRLALDHLRFELRVARKRYERDGTTYSVQEVIERLSRE